QMDESPLAGLASALRDAGWEIGALPGGVDRLVAGRAGAELRASYAATGAFVLTLSSAPVLVGVDRARELVRR
ncbi:MAG: hypothetical protein WBP61_19715, partial [Nocardioides sp.]